MFKKFGIPILAGLGVVLAVVVIVIGSKKPPTPPIENPPPRPPFVHFVAGSGIIEANTLNINIGTAIDGLIEEVFVIPGQMVKKGDPLFRVDTRELVAAVKEAEAGKSVQLATLNRLLSEPRPEEVPILEARVRQAKGRLADEFSQYTLFHNVADKRAISFNEYNQRKYAAQVAKYTLDQAEADLNLLKAGAWEEDLRIAGQRVEEADARLALVSTNLERATARAPFDGMVLQVNINVGDFARGGIEATLLQDALLVFGGVNPLHVRIDVDEEDAWRVFPGANAMAYVRGNSSIKFPLHFVRIEPYVIPKRSLTGENLERVDTRVLQVIYRFEKNDLPIYPGQLLDIFIEAKPSQGL
jgi:HlyD family secretion protein